MQTTPFARALAALAVLAVLTACTPGDDDAEPSVSASDGAAGDPTTSGSTPAEAGGEMLLGGGAYRVTLPEGWTVDDTAPDDARVLDATVLTPDGTPVLHFDIAVTDGTIGGACAEGAPEVLVLRSEPSDLEVDTPQGDALGAPTIVTAVAPQADGSYWLGIGLATAEAVQAPTCLFYFAVNPIGDPAVATFATGLQLDPYGTPDRPDTFVFATIEDVNAYLETEEYASIIEILGSLTYVA